MRDLDNVDESAGDEGAPPAIPARFFGLLTFAMLLLVGGLVMAAASGFFHSGTVVVPAATATLSPTLAASPATKARTPGSTIVTPTRPPAETPAAAAPPPERLFQVGNTGGDGVWLRRTPDMADVMVAWPDGAKMVEVGEDVVVGSLHWKKVRDPAGNEGYIPAQFLVTSNP